MTHSATTNSGSSTTSSATTNSFVWWDGAQQDQTQYTPTTASPGTVWNTNSSYDSQGHVSAAAIYDGRSRAVSYIIDAAGLIMARQEARLSDPSNTNNPLEVRFYFGGIQRGAT